MCLLRQYNKVPLVTSVLAEVWRVTLLQRVVLMLPSRLPGISIRSVGVNWPSRCIFSYFLLAVISIFAQVWTYQQRRSQTVTPKADYGVIDNDAETRAELIIQYHIPPLKHRSYRNTVNSVGEDEHSPVHPLPNPFRSLHYLHRKASWPWISYNRPVKILNAKTSPAGTRRYYG